MSMTIESVADFRRAVRMGPYAWPGGYDVFAITSDGATLCAECMTTERRLIVDAIARKDNSGWRVLAVDCTANTDDNVTCDNCYTVVQRGWKEDDEEHLTARYSVVSSTGSEPPREVTWSHARTLLAAQLREEAADVAARDSDPFLAAQLREAAEQVEMLLQGELYDVSVGGATYAIRRRE